ncbi:hypothetical protein BV25DRAFT_1825409 [Artomyces pyxidatus]|uniref:Uncharacterized protein n=1 Tax=Artomyces pyxidatus TaxID=48021 RepID=A0ACB8T0T6_9AGAM|nr:hypothetical protein BV25DRAFT_1825409 [Artomyces pyxidatus]
MADMQSLLDAYFRAGTPAPMGCKIPEARASSALEGYHAGPYYARVSRALLDREGDGASLFAWSWFDRLGETLVLNPCIDTRAADSDSDRDTASPANDSGYASESACMSDIDKYASFGYEYDTTNEVCLAPPF